MTCPTGKRCHALRKHARAAERWHERHGDDVTVYRCRKCRKWHVGHRT